MSESSITTEQDVPAANNNAADRGTQNARRTRLFLGLLASVATLGGAYYAYDLLIASRHVETDNAYVGANIAQVTPLIGGPVREVLVDDALHVKEGDVLVRLDDTDARIALMRAEAELALTERRVRGLIATDSGLDAQIAARAADEVRAQAQVSSAQADLARAKIDLGEYSGTFKLIEQIIDPGKRVLVFDGDFIESSVVNAHPLRLVFLLHKNHRSTPGGSTRTYVPLFFQLFQLFLYFGQFICCHTVGSLVQRSGSWSKIYPELNLSLGRHTG